MSVTRIFQITLLAWIVAVGSGARILALFPYIGKSHFVVFEPYVKELATRGHQVVVVSHFPQKNPIKNLKDISLVGSQDIDATDRLNLTTMSGLEYLNTAVKELTNLVTSCNKTLSFYTVQNLIDSREKFDVVIAEMFTTDCIIPLAHKFKAPLIGISSCATFPWIDYKIGNPHNPSFVPNLFTSFSDNMNFFERLINTVCEVLFSTIYSLTEGLVTQNYVNHHFRDEMPLLSELAKNTSLILVNTHFTLNRPRPLLPGMVEVGGLYLKPPKLLPKDLDDFLNGAEHGVIYFNMGSMIRAETLPPEKRDAFLQAFAEFPQRVLWKWEGDTLPGQPKNVKIVKWLPQFDVLSHPNVYIYLGHGGLMGTIEAMYAGVPMIGIPFFGDQGMNIAAIESANAGLQLEYADINKESVLRAIKTLLEEPSYRKNAKRMSQIFKDRPHSAMDTAIYWTEYVIRHNGAPHLRSAALDLSWYQYYC
ncbi:hypothetical protein L9F63_003536 [Diploptera punctata]|uniref:UDP-glucuronosyltransferase n=1 Tax=Diploptera punctata TaxID=6984 RepID=A0AAD7ZL44_DIPPU|nr:hypothetical protein L9F63_003536 [Diploptera punctata]